MESTTLYFKQGSSDKVYQAGITSKDGGYVVQFSYGRRGSTMTTGTKTLAPVEYDEAKRTYEKLIKEKTAKGYRVGEGGTTYQHAPEGQSSTGIHCQLLNPIEEDQVERFIADPAYWAQEKHDGRRLLVQNHDGQITGINKLGFPVSVPEPIAKAARGFKQDFLIDGEAVGDVLYAFDLLSIDGKDVRGGGYADRSLHLLNLLASHHQQQIRMVESSFLPFQKRQLLDRLRALNKEGIVFKHFLAHYEAGRPASGGSQFKFKFCESASCLVGKVNARRSVRLELFDGDRLVSVGNVTIPANHKDSACGSYGRMPVPVCLPGRQSVPTGLSGPAGRHCHSGMRSGSAQI